MSRNELIDAYLSGTINRRSFIQGLMALGVSTSVAASYAVALQPAAAAARDVSDEVYPQPQPQPRPQPQLKPKKKAKKASQCKNGGFADFGFKNQGQCIRFVNRNDDKGKKGKKGKN